MRRALRLSTFGPCEVGGWGGGVSGSRLPVAEVRCGDAEPVTKRGNCTEFARYRIREWFPPV